MSGMLIIALVLPTQTGASLSQRLTVSVELARLDRPRFDALDATKFYQSLVLRFVAEGLALIDPTQGADIAVAISTSESGAVVVSVDTARGRRSANLAMELPLDESTRLSLVQTTVVMAREALADLTVVTPPASRSARPEPDTWGGGAHVAVLRSAEAWGALASVEARAERGRWSGALGASGHVPIGISRNLQIREWGAYVGAGVGDVLFGSWLAWRAEAVGGVWQQYSHFQNDTGVDVATSRLDPFLLLRLSALATIGAWHLGAELGGLGLLHDREYRTATTQLWHAPQIRLYLGAVIECMWTGKSP